MSHPFWLHALFAIFAVTGVMIVKYLFGEYVFTASPFLLFYAAVTLSAWYGGLRSGIFATILSVLAVNFLFFSSDSFATAEQNGDGARAFFFVLEALLITGLSHSMHLSLQRLDQQNRDLTYYASIARNISDAVITTDVDHVIQSWNDAAEALYGWKRSEVLGCRMPDIVPTIYTDHTVQFEEEVMRSGSWKGEVIQFRRNNSRVYVLTSVSLLKDEEGNPLGMVTVNRDITERKKLEQGKDDFVALASHELKTPITSIKLFTELLEQRFEKNGDRIALSYLMKTESQVNKLSELVKHLLDVSRVQAGKIPFNFEDISIGRFVRETVKDLQRISSTHRIVFEAEHEAVVSADRDRLRQVLVNLITNAIKYSPNAEKVVIRVEIEEGTVIISVADFGIGIPKDQQDKIFHRFYQVSDAKGYTFSGLGLGLYISSEIVHRHGGELRVTSQEGKGSTFFLIIPEKRSENILPRKPRRTFEKA